MGQKGVVNLLQKRAAIYVGFAQLKGNSRGIAV
jgi:hypothetical protein